MGEKIERLSEKVQLARYFVPTYPNPRFRPGGDQFVDAHWVETDDFDSLPEEEKAAIRSQQPRSVPGDLPGAPAPGSREAREAASRADLRNRGTTLEGGGFVPRNDAEREARIARQARAHREAVAAERVREGRAEDRDYPSTAAEIMPDGLPRVTTTTVANPGWSYEDARGVKKRGVVENTVDRGGTDVTYFMRSESGDLDLLRGELLKKANRTPGFVRVPRKDAGAAVANLEAKSARMAQFEEVFRTELDRAIREHPGEYEGMTPESVPGTVARIMPAIGRGKVNKDTPAMRATFKRLGLRHTYKALQEWFDEGNEP